MYLFGRGRHARAVVVLPAQRVHDVTAALQIERGPGSRIHMSVHGFVPYEHRVKSVTDTCGHEPDLVLEGGLVHSCCRCLEVSA